MGQANKVIESFQKKAKLPVAQVSHSYKELISVFPLQPIRTQGQHEAALKLAEILIDALEIEQDEGLELYLSTLSELIINYEEKMYDAPKTSGREMLAYLMELKGFTQVDIAREMGGQPNVSKILKGERDLNLRQIRELAKKFKVSPSLFL